MLVTLIAGLFGAPFITLLMYVWMDHTAPQPQLWGPLSVIPYSQLLGVIAAVGWLIHTKDKFKVVNPIFYMIALFTVWICVTTFFAQMPDGAYWKWDRTMKVLLSSALVGLMLTSKWRFSALFWTIVLAVGVYIVRGGVRTLATGGGGDLIVGLDGTFVGERNTFATTVAGTLPLIYALIRYPIILPDAKWVRLSLWAVFALGCITIVGSYSRSGMLALGAVLVLMVAAFSKRRVIMLGMFSGLVMLSIPFLPPDVLDRIQSIGDYQEDGSSTNRIDAWKFAVKIAIDSPVVGGGFKVFLKNVPPPEVKTNDGYIDAHSFFFEILGEHGFIGIGLFCLLWIMTALSAVKIGRRRGGQDLKEPLEWHQVYGRCLVIGLCGYSLGGLFNALGSYAYFYLVFCTVGSLAVLSKSEKLVVASAPSISLMKSKSLPIRAF